MRCLRSRFSTWHDLARFATEKELSKFREMKKIDVEMKQLIATRESQNIDFADYESKSQHPELVQALKHFYETEMASLREIEKQKPEQVFLDQRKKLEETSLATCQEAVERSQEIVENGAKALWISFHNPPLSEVDSNDWLDVDQYFAAYVEKYHHYSSHYNIVMENPESKAYEQKQAEIALKKWEIFDGRGSDRMNNKLLTQKPSYEYYDLYRGVFFEHMVYHLLKTGTDARLFPEMPTYESFLEIYNAKHEVVNCLQRRRRKFEEKHKKTGLELCRDWLPDKQLESEGELFVQKLVQRENEVTLVQVSKLMANFQFLSTPYISIQTEEDFLNLPSEGKFYSFGDDVNALFFLPKNTETPRPLESLHAYLDYCQLSGKRLPISVSVLYNEMAKILETRFGDLSKKIWFNLEEETFCDAFLRRFPKGKNSHYEVYEDYCRELKERITNKVELTLTEVENRLKSIEETAKAEDRAFELLVYGNTFDEAAAASKAETEFIKKLAQDNQLKNYLDGEILLTNVNSETLLESLQEFEKDRDAIVQHISRH